MKLKNLLLFGLIFLFMASCGKKEDKIIKIGAILPLTGNVAFLGKWIKNGLELGLEDYKSQNESFDFEISLIFEDSQNEAKLGIAGFNKLIDVDDVDIIISAMSKVSVPLINLVNQRQVPLLLLDVTYPSITKQSKYVFRHFIQSDREAKILAHYSREILKLKNISILTVNDEAGVQAGDSFMNVFNELGGEVLTFDKYEATENDFRTLLLKIRSKKPEGIFVFGNGPSWANIFKQITELGFTAKKITNTAMYIPTFREMAGRKAIDSVLFTFPKIDTSLSIGKYFTDLYLSKFQESPSIESAYAFDLIRFVIKSLQGDEAESYRDRMAIQKEFDSVFGNANIIDRDFILPISIGININDRIQVLIKYY